MAHYLRFVAVPAVLIALVLCVPVEAQTPEIDALRARAEQGDALAQVNLGNRHRLGDGVPQDFAEAVHWYRLAADQRHPRAQQLLGSMHNLGLGVPQDFVQAHMWYNLAASRATGETRADAVNNREIVAGGMSPSQLAEAQRLAREWDAAHPREP